MVSQYLNVLKDKEIFVPKITPTRDYNYNGDIDSPPGTVPHIKGECPGKDNYWHIERRVM